MPLDVSISTATIAICWLIGMSMPYTCAMNMTAKVQYIIDPSRLNE